MGFLQGTKNIFSAWGNKSSKSPKKPESGTKNSPKKGPKNTDPRFRAIYGRAEAYGRHTAAVLRQQRFKRGEVRIYPAVLEPRYLALPLVCRNTARLRTLSKLDRELSHITGADVMIDELPGLVLVQFGLPQKYHGSYTLADLPDAGAVGLGLRRKPVNYDFTDSAPHAVVAGTTGSGKTTTETTAIVSLTRRHTRDQLQFVILDPKRELADDLRNFSYLAWPEVAVADDEIDAAMRFVAGEFRQRRQLSKRDRAGLPRMVIVVDEMSLVGDKSAEAAETLDNVARLGRSLRMNLMIGVQEPHKSDSTRQMDGMLLNRFVGLVKSASDSYLVSGKAGLKAHELTGRGDFLHSHPDGGVFRFQAAMTSAADIDSLPRGGLPAASEPPPIIEVQKPPVDDDPPGRGAPAIDLDPDYLAWYFVRYADRGGWKAARSIAANNEDDIKITETRHAVHAPFVARFREALEKWRD
jgi:hypothetical protein